MVGPWCGAYKGNLLCFFSYFAKHLFSELEGHHCHQLPVITRTNRWNMMRIRSVSVMPDHGTECGFEQLVKRLRNAIRRFGPNARFNRAFSILVKIIEMYEDVIVEFILLDYFLYLYDMRGGLMSLQPWISALLGQFRHVPLHVRALPSLFPWPCGAGSELRYGLPQPPTHSNHSFRHMEPPSVADLCHRPPATSLP